MQMHNAIRAGMAEELDNMSLQCKLIDPVGEVMSNFDRESYLKVFYFLLCLKLYVTM